MRLLVSFFGALLVALGLFALMLTLVMPPRDDRPPESELTRVSFVRSVADSDSDTRERQQREEPQPPEPVEPLETAQAIPDQPAPQAQLQLDIAIPNVQSNLTLSRAPSLEGLTAAPSEVAPAPTPAPPAAATPSVSEEVTPLVDIPPNYPQRALAAGIEGSVTLAFTITAEGRVDNLRVIEAEPPGVFEREARRAAMRWRFEPRRVNGQAVARDVTKTLTFRLEGTR